MISDRRFDSSDINTILAAKRAAIGTEGLLEFIDSPVALDEIGGLTHLKSWLCDRQGCSVMKR